MKKILLLVLAVGSAAVATADDQTDRLVELSRRVHRMIARNADLLTVEERREVRRNLQDIQRVLRDDHPDHGSDGYFCSAGCTDYRGVIDSKFTAGAEGEFEAQARQRAIQAAQSKYRCTHDVKIMGCDQTERYSQFSAMAACTDYRKVADLKFVGLGDGNSLEMARQAAREDTMASYKCTHSVKDVDVSDGRTSRSYCVAACTDYRGTPDRKYSADATGNNMVEAKARALKAVMKQYKCTHSVKIVDCQSDRLSAPQ